MGSGIAIGYAGPSVVLSYAIAGFIAFVMVFSVGNGGGASGGRLVRSLRGNLSQSVGRVRRSLHVLDRPGRAVGGEAVAAGVYMTYWFPDVPIWPWSVGFALILVYVNARSVGNFGTFEYWFALIKVMTIVLFIILGSASILGIGLEPVGFHNLTGLPGGFMPHGLGGMWMAVIMGVFSFNGVEVIAVTAGEVRDPETAIPAALRNMVVRLFLFYVLALGIVVTFVPWTESGAKVVTESPFVSVLQYSGLPYAAAIMNFVVISAALSSMNVNIYLSSRMLFSLSRGNYAPAFLGRLSRTRSPLAAILTSGGGIICTAAIAKLTPLAYNYLFGIALFGAIVVWMFILVSHLSFRRHHAAADLPVRMPFFPCLQSPASGCCWRSWSRWVSTPSSGTSPGSSAFRGWRSFGGLLCLGRGTAPPRRQRSAKTSDPAGTQRMEIAACSGTRAGQTRKCGMTSLPSSSMAACGSGPSGPPKPISSTPSAPSASICEITSSGVPTIPSLSMSSVTSARRPHSPPDRCGP